MEMRTAHVDAILQFEKTGDLVGEWDANRLTQVVSNLVGNAIQPGAGTPVTLAAKDEGKTVRLTVHNGGEPIPPAAIKSIFEPLRRAQIRPDVGRSIGLGLFIAREIVMAHGGEITVTSSSDLGTIFSVLLPKKAESYEADKSKKGPQDRSRINLRENYEVRFWSEKFGVSAERLRVAVNKVGNSAKAVEEELKRAA